MAALFGREDQLLETSRFARFLRQANDAEMADVRTLGDGSFEVSPHRTDLGFARNAIPAPLAEAGEGPSGNGAQAAGPGAEPQPPVAALRFRRGSRSPMRPQDIPLVGMVRFDDDAPAPPVAAPIAAEAPPARAPARRGGPGRGRAPKAPASPPAASAAPGAPPRPPKSRPRARPKKTG